MDRWEVLRKSVFKTKTLERQIDAMAQQVRQASGRNFDKWTSVGPHISWQWELDNVKRFLSSRVAWVDAQFPDIPHISIKAGTLNSESQIEIKTTTGLTAYYTLDGSDPRSPGGKPSPEATAYEAPLAMGNKSVIKIRAWDGKTWQGAPHHAPWSAVAQIVLEASSEHEPGKVPVPPKTSSTIFDSRDFQPDTFRHR